MSQDLVAQDMSDAQRDALVAAADNFLTLFAQYRVNLTTDQIAGLLKLRAEDVALLDLALNYADQNPTAIPADFPLAKLQQDTALAKQEVIVNAKVQQTADIARVALIAVLSDAVKPAYELYRMTKARGRTPQNQEFLDAFGTRFPRGPKPDQPAPPPPP